MKRWVATVCSVWLALLLSHCASGAGMPGEARSTSMPSTAAQFISSVTPETRGEEKPEPSSAAPAQRARVCAEPVASPLPFGAGTPLDIAVSEGEHPAEWFVAPGVFSRPQEVFVSPQNEIIVWSPRNITLARVAADGAVTILAKDAREIEGYAGTMDEAGNIYLIGTNGKVVRVSSQLRVETVVDSPRLASPGNNYVVPGPDGNLYITLEPPPGGGKTKLYRLTPDGELTFLTALPPVRALRVTSDGRLLAAGDSVYEISLNDFSYTNLLDFFNPQGGYIPPGGLTSDDQGGIYFSMDFMGEHRGELYRFAHGKIDLLAATPGEGLAGIEYLPSTREIVGGQIRNGGVLAVGLDGQVRTLVPGSGLITPTGIAFSPCGELAVANDDGGMMTLISPAGEVAWMMDYVSFNPPLAYLTFDAEGTLYASEAALGFLLARVFEFPAHERAPLPLDHSGVAPAETLYDGAAPTGVAWRTDGVLFISDQLSGEIIQINSDGETTVFVSGLDHPQGLALDDEGNLYVVVGISAEAQSTAGLTSTGNAVLQVTPSGDVHRLAELPGLRGLAVSPQGELFAVAGNSIFRIHSDAPPTLFAQGFAEPTGLAFDLTGDLYVSDTYWNGIVRIGGFPQGTLGGTVRGENGQPIAGARIQLLAESPQPVGQVVYSDETGQFHLTAASRTYRIQVSAPGYSPWSAENITVTTGQETTIEIVLSP